jgi:hypothetical protein
VSLHCSASSVPSSTPPSSTPPRPVEPELLRALLDAALADPPHHPDDGAVALGVQAHGDELDLAVRPLDGPDPVRSLFGFVAPPEWSAFGVLAAGRARSLDPGEDARVVGSAGRRVHLGLLVTRQGEQVVAVHGDDDLAEQPLHLDAAEHGTGRIPDACRRVLQLPTAPPERDTRELWATLWLETLLVRSLADPHPIAWSEVVHAYPAFDAVVDGDAALGALVSDHLVELGHAACRAWRWDELLGACAAGQVPACGVDPEVATWMDVGMFSREVLGQFPAIDDLVVDLGTVLAADVAARIDRCLDAWGVR